MPRGGSAERRHVPVDPKRGTFERYSSVQSIPVTPPISAGKLLAEITAQRHAKNIRAFSATGVAAPAAASTRRHKPVRAARTEGEHDAAVQLSHRVR